MHYMHYTQRITVNGGKYSDEEADLSVYTTRETEEAAS